MKSLSTIRFCLWLALVTLGTSFGFANAHADQSPVAAPHSKGIGAALLGFEASGGDLVAHLPSYNSRLRQMVASHPGFFVADRGMMGVEEAKLMFGCFDDVNPCMVEAGRSIGAEVVVFGLLASAPKQAVEMRLSLLDVESGEVRGHLGVVLPAKKVEAAFAREVGGFLDGLVGAEQEAPALASLSVLCEEEGGTVMVGGQEVGPCSVAGLQLAPGRHSVVVKRVEDLPPWMTSVELEPGEKATVRVPAVLTRNIVLGRGHRDRLLLLEEATIPPPTFAPKYMRTLALGSLGTAAAAGIAGSVFGVLVMSFQEQYDATSTSRLAHRYADSGERYATAANLCFGTAAVMALTGGALYYLSMGR